MKQLARGIVAYRFVTICVFAVLTAAALVLTPHVNVVYQPAGGPPPGSSYEGGSQIRIMAEGLRLPEAIELKRRLETVEGVESVLWLDDIADIYAKCATLPSKASPALFSNSMVV